MADYKKLAKEARIEILRLVHKGQTSHIASNFSVVDIATVLYENLQKEDRVVWSKGWAAAAIYYFLHKQGKITTRLYNLFPNKPMYGLAETTVNGVEVNGGSVGHGLSVAVGMALGKKRAGESGTVYCIMSDGELNEGSVWEAAMVAHHHKLDNLIAIIDKNGWQAMGRTEDVINLDAVNAFNGFGWFTRDIDGHDHAEIERVIIQDKYDAPKVIVARTIKGKGVSFMEDHLVFHYKNVDDELYQKALTELNAQ